MSGVPKHPGATGVPEPLDWKLNRAQRIVLVDFMHGWKLERFDEQAFVEAIELAIEGYLQSKVLAEKSSAGSIRRNLTRALIRANSLITALLELDGNSAALVRECSKESMVSTLGEHAFLKSAHEIPNVLQAALHAAKTRYPGGGSRPKHERDHLAAFVKEALLTHTSAKPSGTRSKIFEELLIWCLEFAGERRPTDLHILTARAVKDDLITRTEGYVEVKLPSRR